MALPVVALTLLSLMLGSTVTSTEVASTTPAYRHLVNNDGMPKYVRGKGAYNWVLSPLGLGNGISYLGANTRLRVAMQKLKDGKPFHITTVGTSVTAGSGVSDGHTWPQYLFNYLQDHYGDQVTGLNSGVGATRVAYLNVCHNLHIPDDTDLIIVEYSISSICNTRYCPEDRASEQLLRKVLSYPKKPAVFFAHPIPWWQAENRIGNWWYGGESQYTELSMYYQIPAISLRACCWHLFISNFPGFNCTPRRFGGQPGDAFWVERVHPDGLTGARVFAELAINLITRTLDSLETEPITAAEQAFAVAPLPEPLTPGNYEATKHSCFMNSHFLSLVRRNESFTWVNESRDRRFVKLGMVATTVGAALEIGLDTRRAPGSTSTSSVIVLIAYLKSYQHMGCATVECISGCSCEPSQINGHSEQYSLMEFHQVEVSEAEVCVMRITVNKETAAGEHKVKIMGAMVSEVDDKQPFAQWVRHLGNTAQGAGARRDGVFDIRAQHWKSHGTGTA